MFTIKVTKRTLGRASAMGLPVGTHEVSKIELMAHFLKVNYYDEISPNIALDILADYLADPKATCKDGKNEWIDKTDRGRRLRFAKRLKATLEFHAKTTSSDRMCTLDCPRIEGNNRHFLVALNDAVNE